MNSALNKLDRSTRRRPLSLTPYGLLLVLALFLAGQVASAAHWHDVIDTPDVDCALCMLSSANGAAAIGTGFQFLTTFFSGFAVFLFVPMARRTVVRFHDSRAPPSLLNLHA